MSEIEAIIFDAGNVLVRVDWKPTVGEFCARTGKAPEQLTEFIDLGKQMENLSLGLVSPQGFFDSASRALGFDGDIEEFARIWCECLRPVEPMMMLAAQLRGRVRQFILSNTNPFHGQWLRDHLPCFAAMDGHVFSYEVGLLKPDRRIYELSLQRFGVQPQRAVFVDDAQANIEAARAVGLHAIHHRDAEDTRQQLAKLGLRPT